MSGSKWLADKALAQLRNVPRVTLNSLNKVGRNPVRRPRGKKSGGYDYGFTNALERRMRFPPIGYEHFVIPKAYKTQVEKHYNHGWDSKRQYPPLSVLTLQLLIDTGRLDASKPVDLAAVCNTKVFLLEPKNRHFGINLTDDGSDRFEAKLNLEVQYASEQAIAAVERNGGVITTAYFDINSVIALANPLKWFAEGKPIPRRLQPPAGTEIKYSKTSKLVISVFGDLTLFNRKKKVFHRYSI